MAKVGSKRINKKPFQMWLDEDLKKHFKALVETYDPDMPLTNAIVKVIKQAVEDWYLPGYVKKEKPATVAVVSNDLSHQINTLAKKGVDNNRKM